MVARRSSEPQDGVRLPGEVLNNKSLECAGFARDSAKVEDQVQFLARMLGTIRMYSPQKHLMVH